MCDPTGSPVEFRRCPINYNGSCKNLQDIHPLELCKFASNVLELPISSRNAIKISTGRPVDSNGPPVDLLYWTSFRAEYLEE